MRNSLHNGEHARRRARLSAWLRGAFVVLSAMIVVLCLTSWIVGIYVEDVNGVFTARGLRWMVGHVMQNFSDAPLGKIVCALIAIGGIKECGVARSFSRRASLKQRRALQITGAAVALFAVALAAMLLWPGELLLSSFGGLYNSPLQKGWYAIACALALTVSNVHGYTSGRFVRLADFVDGHVALLAGSAPYFLTLFAATQVVAVLDYSDLLALLGHEEAVLAVVRPVLYYVPLLACVLFPK